MPAGDPFGLEPAVQAALAGGGGGGGGAPPPVFSLITRAVQLGVAETLTGGSFSLGRAFSVLESVTITGARIYRAAMGTASVKVTLYASNKVTVLATKTVTAPHGDSTVIFDAPVSVTPTDGLVYLQFHDLDGNSYHCAQSQNILPFVPALPEILGSCVVSDWRLYNNGDSAIGTPNGHLGLIEPVFA